MDNVIRKSYLNHNPELSRVGAADLLGVSRFTLHRWENFLTGQEPSSFPRSLEHREKMQELFGVPAEIWQERLEQLSGGEN